MSKLSDIRDFSKKLSKSARWHNTNQAIMHITSTKNTKKRNEYVYEFYCVLRTLAALADVYDDIGTLNTKYKKVFPKSPAAKNNFPYFSIKNQTQPEAFQVCYGTEIRDDEDIPFAPDISFQKPGTGLNPKSSDVLMIWDAKYKHDETDSVHRSEFLYVSGLITSLELKNITPAMLANINLGSLKTLKGNCILTNGKAYVTKSNFHKKHLLKEVEQFTNRKSYKVIGA